MSLIVGLLVYLSSNVHSETYKGLVRARDFMRCAYDGPIGLREVSAQANLSPHHFLRVYRETFQETPHEFLTRLRVERAKTLLASGSHNVTEACFEVGYSSVGSFSALFAGRVGLSPSEYRRYARTSVTIPREARSLFIPSCLLVMLRGEPQLSRSEGRSPQLFSVR